MGICCCNLEVCLKMDIPTFRDWPNEQGLLLLQRMNQRSRHTKVSIAAGLFLGLFLVLLVNNSLFQHVHVLDNGKIIRHAHPFNKSDEGSPLSQHKHSTCEFNTLHAFSLFEAERFFESEFIPFSVSFEFQIFTSPFLPNVNLGSAIGRSPPTVV